MASPDRIRLTELSSRGGCASKVGAADLAQVLRRLPFPHHPNVLVDSSTSDDAGVYQLRPDLALVLTVDFFTPIVDDPYDFGRIAAANALSDVYAMGGAPICALNIATFPIDDLDGEILSRILEGGLAVATAAGVAILGGHTVKDAEPKYGLAVTGIVHPERIVTNAGARPGDVLLLTKPIGAGIIMTARKRDAIGDPRIKEAITEMVRLNDKARDAMLAHGAHAATDVTGFGLIGHAREMARASDLTLEIVATSVPLLEGVLELIEAGFVPGGTEANLADHAGFTSYRDELAEPLKIALSDAMTSGGLLIAAEPDAAARILADLRPTHRVAVIGSVSSDPGGGIIVL